ncbi:MAG: class I SAM-dependent methyltransferase [Desulfobacterales bacterium]|nr:class I SAM-dependent methyltransferase [Desulfobacterales bacterium]
MFHAIPENTENILLIPASLRTWTPAGDYDLITCVHGIHYIGDKLGLIQRAASWLKHDGFFIANLDITDFRLNDNRPMRRQISKIFRESGIDYNRTKHILCFLGKKNIKIPYHYIGSDDQAGPNYTGQPAVHSYYRLQADESH